MIFLDKPSLDENIKLRGIIEGDEKDTHDNVKKLLRKYEKYRVSNVFIVLLNVNCSFLTVILLIIQIIFAKYKYVGM